MGYTGVGAILIVGGGIQPYVVNGRHDLKMDWLAALKAANSEDGLPIFVGPKKTYPWTRVILCLWSHLVLLTFFFYWYATGSVVLALSGALFFGCCIILFAAVAGYIAELVVPQILQFQV